MILSKAQIWDRTRPRSSSYAASSARVLARGALDRKKGAEDRLLAVEVQRVRAGKALADFLTQFGPAGGRRASSEAVQYRGVRGPGGDCGRAAGDSDGKPCQQLAEQVFDRP